MLINFWSKLNDDDDDDDKIRMRIAYLHAE